MSKARQDPAKGQTQPNPASLCSLCSGELEDTPRGAVCPSCDEVHGRGSFGVSYRVWQRKVDQYLYRLAGLTSRDLPDQRYRDWFDDGLGPQPAAERALERTATDYGLPSEWVEGLL